MKNNKCIICSKEFKHKETTFTCKRCLLKKIVDVLRGYKNNDDDNKLIETLKNYVKPTTLADTKTCHICDEEITKDTDKFICGGCGKVICRKCIYKCGMCNNTICCECKLCTNCNGLLKESKSLEEDPEN